MHARSADPELVSMSCFGGDGNRIQDLQLMRGRRGFWRACAALGRTSRHPRLQSIDLPTCPRRSRVIKSFEQEMSSETSGRGRTYLKQSSSREKALDSAVTSFGSASTESRT